MYYYNFTFSSKFHYKYCSRWYRYFHNRLNTIEEIDYFLTICEYIYINCVQNFSEYESFINRKKDFMSIPLKSRLNDYSNSKEIPF